MSSRWPNSYKGRIIRLREITRLCLYSLCRRIMQQNLCFANSSVSTSSMWSYISSKHRIYTYTCCPSQTYKSPQKDKWSPNINSATIALPIYLPFFHSFLSGIIKSAIVITGVYNFPTTEINCLVQEHLSLSTAGFF